MISAPVLKIFEFLVIINGLLEVLCALNAFFILESHEDGAGCGDFFELPVLQFVDFLLDDSLLVPLLILDVATTLTK